MKIRMKGYVCQLCRWQVTYQSLGHEVTEYVPTEAEADALVQLYGGTKTALDTAADEWADGITVPETSIRPKTDAEAIIARGKSAYLNSQAIPSADRSAVEMMRRLLKTQLVEDDDERLRVSGLYDDWTAGNHSVGDVYNANGQTWECFQSYDNSIYPDINPDNSAWYTFNRPLHGKTPETARPFVPVQGAHDMYRAGEYMIWTDGLVYHCKLDTSFSPEDYAPAWEVHADG